MAQIDSNIYFQQTTADPLGSYAEGVKMGDLYKKAKQQSDVENAFKAAIVTNPDGTSTLDKKVALSGLAKVDPLTFLNTQTKFNEDSLAQQKLTHEKINQFTNYLASASDQVKKDPTSYPMVLADAKTRGYDISSMPPQYGPDAQQKLDFYQGQALTAKEKMDNAIKQRELDIKNQELALKKTEANTKLGGGNEGRKAVDKDYAKDYNDWTSAGRATVEKNLERLRNAKAALAEDSSLTGSIRGNTPDVIRNFTNEKAIQTRDDVRAAAQGALKATLGAQFTEKEGERIMNQSYNEKLSPEANIEKIDAAIKELETNRENNDRKAVHFQKYGTLNGLNAVTPESNNISNLKDKKPAAPQAASAHPEADQALAWAKQNPNNPKAAEILKRLAI